MPYFLLSCDKFSRLYSYRFTVNFSGHFRAVLCKFSAPFSYCFSIYFCPHSRPHFCLHFRPSLCQILPHRIARFLSAPTRLSLQLLRVLRLCFATPTDTPYCAPEGLLSAFRRNFFALRRLPPEFLCRCPTKCLDVANNDTDNQINTNLHINDCL